MWAAGPMGGCSRLDGSASTHVSFDPPPWLELTTRLPAVSATRLRPPGTTQTFSPSLIANGRRSTCPARDGRRCASARSTVARPPGRSIGEVRRGCLVAARTARPVRPRADDQAGSARAVDRFADQGVEAIEHHFEDVGPLEPVRLDRVQHRLFAEVIADHGADERIDGLVVGNPVAHAVGDRDVPRSGRVHDAGAAEHGVRPELDRVDELVVHPPIDDVHRSFTFSRAHQHAAVATHEVTTLDQLDPHLPGEEAVLEVRRVVDARGEDDDRGIDLAVGGRARNASNSRDG